MMASFDHVVFFERRREGEGGKAMEATERQTDRYRAICAVWEGPWWDPDFCRGGVGNQQEHKQQVPHGRKSFQVPVTWRTSIRRLLFNESE